MKYISIDLETTCIDPKCPENMLQIAMVAENTEASVDVSDLPHFRAIIIPEAGTVTGSLTALAMNAWIMVAIELHKKVIRPGVSAQVATKEAQCYFDSLGVPQETIQRAIDAYLCNRIAGLKSVITQANDWIDGIFGKNAHGIIAAGKNVAGFDMNFLPSDLKRRFSHRTIDPGSVLIDWTRNAPPTSNDLAAAYGEQVDGAVSHDAYQDAKDVITWLRRSYPKTEI